jgi:hypothetical protein
MEQLRGGHRRAENSAGGSDVPAAIIMSRRNGVTDTAGDLCAEREGMKQLRPAHRPHFRQRKHDRCDGRGRMDDRSRMGVVEIEDVHGGGVEKGSRQRIPPRVMADDGRGPAGGKGRKARGQTDHRLIGRAAERGPEAVEYGPQRMGADRAWHVLPARAMDKRREPARQAGMGRLCGQSRHGFLPAIMGSPVRPKWQDCFGLSESLRWQVVWRCITTRSRRAMRPSFCKKVSPSMRGPSATPRGERALP